MTDSPPPSGRPETAKMAAFVLLRPILFAISAIGLTLGLLVLLHRPVGQVAETPVAPPRPPPVVLAESELARPISAAVFQVFQIDPRAHPADAVPPARDS